MSKDQESITSELESISSGSYWFLLGWAFEYIAGFLTQILLTNSLSTASYGVYAFIRKLIAVVVGLSSGGSKTALNRFLPKYTDESAKQDGVLGLSLMFSVGGSLFLGTVIYVSAPLLSALTFTGELTTGIVQVVAFTFPLIAAIKVLSGAFRALELVRLSILIDWVIRPGILLVVVGGVILVDPSLERVVAALVVASIATLGASTTLFVVYTEHTPSLEVPWSLITDYFKYSLPLVLSQSSSLLFRRIDIFMLSYLSVSTAVAVYNVALLLSGTLLLPLSGFSQLFPPIASRMYEQSDMGRLTELYSTVTRWSVMLTSAGFVGLVVYRGELLAIFGSDYTAGAGILIVLAFGQLVNSAAGPAGHLLGMTDHQYVLLANRTIMSVSNALLNYLLLTRYGAIGAAVATALVFASLNVARVVEVYMLEGMYPYDRSFLKFLPALGVAALVMYSIRSLLTTPLSYVGIPIGLAVYMLTLYQFGMQQVDRNLVTQIATRAVDIVKS
ncbi:oligosaccharide flippase family protein [Halomicrobium sp. LC1Hm]|uniref:oligosaccharide flippase family protein n=1 Tax=Halomicrobium sp. LC1Hm TaxID=2610902 RepID=UPI0012983FF5|nr:oligosaccharide flippase family protein [Halomicrobium sp. LC1Hm]QGA81917.1 MATE family membrane protein, Rfbx family [Halomicrobium sp. LC1Hm]